MLGQSNDLLQTPEAKAAVSYIVGQVAKFQLLPSRIAALQQVVSAALAQDPTDTQASLYQGTLTQLSAQYSTVAANLASVLQAVNAGSGSLDVLGNAVAVAAQMASLFAATSALEATISGGGSSVATVVRSPLGIVALLGLAALLFVRRRH